MAPYEDFMNVFVLSLLGVLLGILEIKPYFNLRAQGRKSLNTGLGCGVWGFGSTLNPKPKNPKP